MLEKRVSELLMVGAQEEYLERIADAGTEVHGSGNIIDIADIFLEGLKELRFVVTLRAAEDLRSLRDELAALPAKSKIGAARAKRLSDIMSVLWPTLKAESDGTIAYIVSERRFPIDKLFADIGALFADGVFSTLPVFSQQDFSEAGKCLAFERATSAAFHMLRGTESLLREFYARKSPENLSSMMWGQMIDAMRRNTDLFSLPLTNQLDHIRYSFRNPTAYPEKVFDVDEAQDLFSICVDVSNRMARELRSLCSSSGNLRRIRHFEKRGSGSSGLEFKRPAAGAASDGLRWWQV